MMFSFHRSFAYTHTHTRHLLSVVSKFFTNKLQYNHLCCGSLHAVLILSVWLNMSERTTCSVHCWLYERCPMNMRTCESEKTKTSLSSLLSVHCHIRDFYIKAKCGTRICSSFWVAGVFVSTIHALGCTYVHSIWAIGCVHKLSGVIYALDQ